MNHLVSKRPPVSGRPRLLADWVPAVEGAIVKLFDVAITHVGDVVDLALGICEHSVRFCRCLTEEFIVEMFVVFDACQDGFREIVEVLET